MAKRWRNYLGATAERWKWRRKVLASWNRVATKLMSNEYEAQFTDARIGIVLSCKCERDGKAIAVACRFRHAIDFRMPLNELLLPASFSLTYVHLSLVPRKFLSCFQVSSLLRCKTLPNFIPWHGMSTTSLIFRIVDKSTSFVINSTVNELNVKII